MFQSRPVQAARRGRAASLLDDQRRERCVLRCSFHADVHTEAVQAALATYRERKVPLPSKRRSVLTHPSAEACTPPGTMAAAGGPSDPRCPLRWETLACREDSEKPEGRCVSVCGALAGGPCAHSAAVPPTSARPSVFSLRGRVCFTCGGDPWASGFLGLRTLHHCHLTKGPCQAGRRPQAGGLDAACRASGLLRCCCCAPAIPRGVSCHRPHAPGPGQTACGASSVAWRLRSQTW